MSVQSMAWAIEQQTVENPAHRHLLICLANYTGADGCNAFPSQAKLATDTGYSLATIKRYLKALEAEGVIVRGNQAIAAAHIKRADRRPVVYDIVSERGVSVSPRNNILIAAGANGGSQDANGGSETPERGVTGELRSTLNHPDPKNARARKGENQDMVGEGATTPTTSNEPKARAAAILIAEQIRNRAKFENYFTVNGESAVGVDSAGIVTIYAPSKVRRDLIDQRFSHVLKECFGKSWRFADKIDRDAA